MSRFAISLLLITMLVSDVSVRDADACGVKLAIKTLRQRQRAKAAPVAADDKTVIAARAARRPVAVGPNAEGRGVVIRVKPTTEPAKEPAKDPKVAVAQPATTTPPPAAGAAVKAPATTPPPATTTTAAKEPAKEPAKTAVKEPAKKKVAKGKTPAAEPSKTPASDKVATTTAPAAKEAVPAEPLEAEVYFAVGRITLDNLDGVVKVQRWLMANPSQKIVIEGYADPQGRAERNMVLSKQRAEVTRAHLVSQGIAESRIEIAAFGDTKLKYDRTDDRNRRVLIHSK